MGLFVLNDGHEVTGIAIRHYFNKNIPDSTVSHIHQKTPGYGTKRKAGFNYWLPSLLLVMMLKETGALSDPCSELKREIDYVKKINHKSEILVFQCQEKLKNGTHALEVAFRSLKLAQDQFISKLQQTEGEISSLKKQLEAKEEILKSNNDIQINLQATIDSLLKTLEVQYLNEEEKCEQPKIATPKLYITFWLQLLVGILIFLQSRSKITELKKRIINLEDQNNNLKEQLETEELVLGFGFETQKQLQTTIDVQTQREEANNRTVQELRETQKQLQTTIDVLTKTLQPYVCPKLFEAVISGDVKTVKILFKCNTDTCTTDDKHRSTPLIRAALNNRVEVVRVLLEGGANVERVNAHQQTALHAAALCGHLEVCRLLLDWGAKVDPVDIRKKTPLHDAANSGILSVVKLLVERGADVNVKNNDGQTASDMARIQGKTDMVNWLESVSRV